MVQIIPIQNLLGKKSKKRIRAIGADQAPRLHPHPHLLHQMKTKRRKNQRKIKKTRKIRKIRRTRKTKKIRKRRKIKSQRRTRKSLR